MHSVGISQPQSESSVVVAVVDVVDVVVDVVDVVVVVVVVGGDGAQLGSEQKSLAVKIPSSLTLVAHQPFPWVVAEGTHLS